MVDVHRKELRSRPNSDPDFMESRELRRRLNLSEQSMRTLIKQGMPYYKPGRRMMFNYEEVKAWLAKYRVGHKV